MHRLIKKHKKHEFKTWHLTTLKLINKCFMQSLIYKVTVFDNKFLNG